MRSTASIRPEERASAGRIGAVMWAIASVSVIAMALVLPAAQIHRTPLVAMGVGGCAWGAFSGLVLDYRRLPLWLIHASSVAGTAAVGIAISLSGGPRSPAWACLFYVVVFSAYYMAPLPATAYFLACVAIEVITVIDAGPASRAQGVGKLVVAVPAFLLLGGALVAGKRMTWSLRGRAQRLAAEQAAMRRVATAAIDGDSADGFYQLVAVEIGRLLRAGGAGILRLDDGREARTLGSWARDPERQFEVGDRFPVAPESDFGRALALGRPLRADTHAPDTALGSLGYQSSISVPIRVGGRTWGLLTIVADGVGELTGAHERRLIEFAGLISTAVTSFEDRAALAAQASTDALTGVANQRTFRERLAADLARARRYDTTVALAMIDVDHFKRVNDACGHEVGDEVLVEVSAQLHAAIRAGDTLARVGGDEFAWIMPETTAGEAVAAVQRARRAISAGAATEARVTISGGICDTSWTSDPTELMRFADRALYASKRDGRDQVRPYAPSGADELAAR
ncbi:MAG: diguanylate cyclase [Solirubrobacteraceae bacterium]